MNVSCDSVNLEHPIGQDTRGPRCVCSAILSRLIYYYFNCPFKGETVRKIRIYSPGTAKNFTYALVRVAVSASAIQARHSSKVPDGLGFDSR
jgi:hypothetical protein